MVFNFYIFRINWAPKILFHRSENCNIWLPCQEITILTEIL